MTTHTREIATERRNPRTAHIDALSTLEMARLMNSEDKRVAEAVEAVCPQIARAIDLIAERLRAGGRLVYCGSGTSGRLGILDAVECPPTFSTDPDRVIGLIAGGPGAVFQAGEGAEDDRPRGETWRIRKEESLEALARTEDEAVRMLWLGDKLSNIRAISRDYERIGDEVFQRFNQKDKAAQKWYFESVLALLSDLSDTAAYREFAAHIRKVFG